MRIAMVSQLAGRYLVRALCRAAFYAGATKPGRPRAAENALLWVKISECFEASHRTYGSPRVAAALRRGGEKCSRHRVAAQIRGLPPTHARPRPARQAKASLPTPNHRRQTCARLPSLKAVASSSVVAVARR